MSTAIDHERIVESLRTTRRELQDIGRHAVSVSAGAYSALVDLETFFGAVPTGVTASNEAIDRERAGAAVRIIRREFDDLGRLFTLSFDKALDSALEDLASAVDAVTSHSEHGLRDRLRQRSTAIGASRFSAGSEEAEYRLAEERRRPTNYTIGSNRDNQTRC